MRVFRTIGEYPLFVVCAASGVAFFVVKGVGLLSDVGDSRLIGQSRGSALVDPRDHGTDPCGVE